MIYLDTSVAMAHLMTEDRHPPSSLWDESLVSSRLLEYELWTSINARSLAKSHGDAARALLARVSLVELERPVLARALDRFPVPLRTLDALHLAAADFLRSRGQSLAVASYDGRMIAGARAMGFDLYALT